MAERPPRVELFCEDVAHERFMQALLKRLTFDAGVRVDIQIRVARGGHGRVISELVTYLRLVQTSPDLLIVAVDANCAGWTQARRDIRNQIDPSRFPNSVVACPDPHIERWYLADPPSLSLQLGVNVQRRRVKCERGRYKNILTGALMSAGHIVTFGGAEFGDEIVQAMDLYRASKAEPSLANAIDHLQSFLNGLRRG
jgi:hypothetical protein